MQKKRAIASARAFLGTPFDLIVDITGLEPTEDWHSWKDTEGNKLRIAKDRSVYVYNSRESKITKDVFRKARPEIIARHSYWLLSFFGKENTLLCFLGNDGLLRSCYFEKNIWQYNMPSLLLGYQTLRYVVSGYIEMDIRKVSSPKITYPKRFEIEEAWASGYPTSEIELQERIECHLTSLEFRD